jgi:hypothetical protein
MPPVPTPRVAVPVVPFQPVHRPPVTTQTTEAASIDLLRQTLDEVQKIVALQKQRRQLQMVRPMPVRAHAPSTVGPTPHPPPPPSRLQQHFCSSPEPEAYLAHNPFCTECEKFHPPLNTNDFGPTNDQLIEAARQQRGYGTSSSPTMNHLSVGGGWLRPLVAPLPFYLLHNHLFHYYLPHHLLPSRLGVPHSTGVSSPLLNPAPGPFNTRLLGPP